MESQAVTDANTVKIRGPMPHELPSVEVERLSKAGLIGTYPMVPTRKLGNNTHGMSERERQGLFQHNLAMDQRRPKGREKLAMYNPLTITDGAKEYFSYDNPVEDAIRADQKAKAALLDKTDTPVPPIKKSAVLRVGFLVILGIGAVAIGYFIFKRGRVFPESIIPVGLN